VARLVKSAIAFTAITPAKPGAQATSICTSPSTTTPARFAVILPDQSGASAQRLFHMTRAHFSRFGFSCRRVLTDNGTHFVDNTPEPAPDRRRGRSRTASILPGSCLRLRAEHRRTLSHQTEHPWTNGQVERMNRTLK
jgi:hypothetical protein